MRFPRQEYWSGLPFPSPGDHPNPGMEPESSALQANSLDSLQPEPPGRSFMADTRRRNFDLYGSAVISVIGEVCSTHNTDAQYILEGKE